MKNYPDIFTTAEVAKICRCSQQTIIREFDRGNIKGYMVGTFRRIPLENLLKYMQETGRPEAWQEPLLAKSSKNGKHKKR